MEPLATRDAGDNTGQHRKTRDDSGRFGRKRQCGTIGFGSSSNPSSPSILLNHPLYARLGVIYREYCHPIYLFENLFNYSDKLRLCIKIHYSSQIVEKFKKGE
jgi:hypothetical protein